MNKKPHWLQNKDSKLEEEKAKQAIFAMAEEAEKKAEIKKDKPRSVRDLQFKDN